MIEFSHGSVSIAPTRAVPLAGWAGEARLTKDLFGTLEANVLAVFSNSVCSAVFVSIDVLFVGRELSDIILSICSEFGVPSSCVLILATHTHFAPALEATKPMLGLRDDDHFRDVSQRLTEKLKSVLGDRPRNGDLSKGQIEVNASVNRRRPWPLPQLTRDGLCFDRVILAPYEQGKTAPLITALVLSGDTTCVIWHYTCHPTDFPDSRISADYPGIVRKALRQRFGQTTTSIFLPGFGGDVRPPSSSRPRDPISVVRTILQGPRFNGMTHNEWEHWANTVATGVLSAVECATDIACTAPIRGRIASITLDRLLERSDPSRLIEGQHLRIFGEDILALSAEPLSGLAALCKPNALLVGYSRDVFGYWPCEADIALGGYEVNGFKMLFGLRGAWRPGPDRIFSQLTQ